MAYSIVNNLQCKSVEYNISNGFRKVLDTFGRRFDTCRIRVRCILNMLRTRFDTLRIQLKCECDIFGDMFRIRFECIQNTFLIRFDTFEIHFPCVLNTCWIRAEYDSNIFLDTFECNPCVFGDVSNVYQFGPDVWEYASKRIAAAVGCTCRCLDRIVAAAWCACERLNRIAVAAWCAC